MTRPLQLCDICGTSTLRERFEEAHAAGQIDWPYTYCANCECPTDENPPTVVSEGGDSRREPYLTDPDVTLYQGDCLEVLRDLPDRSVDMIATSPPFY
jgi:hypothetical protein